MTLVAKTRNNGRPAGGFTLLEIVIVLMIIALILGSAITIMVLSKDERTLTNATGELESFAKRARTIAALQQKPYALEFYENRISLMPLAEAMLDPVEREKAGMVLRAADDDEETNSLSVTRDAWVAEDGTEIFVRRWASDTLIPINSKSRQVWRFDPEGPCEPITVRFRVGKSWSESEFNPLTAGIRDTQSEIY
ncbi:Tfp pilus assembly protein FimT/FimU [Luteolibacter sp. Populi]|uniref:Tfp pilus assembly protein FimT/FimU n=1 Tax=Luteolibacter sp. Populi TaxID=3230487 RepID=UPI0034655870